MHASVFAVDVGAVALVGGKGSGKTTTVLAAVASGAALISNDRLYVWPTGGVPGHRFHPQRYGRIGDQRG